MAKVIHKSAPSLSKSTYGPPPGSAKAYSGMGRGASVTTTSGRKIVIDDAFLEYMDIIAGLLGIDINFEEFCQMSSSERLSYIRDIKLGKIIN